MFVKNEIYQILLKSGQTIFCNVFANEEKGRVRAVAVGCEELALEDIDTDKVFRSVCGIEIREGSLLGKNMLMSDSYVGTAKCAPGDVFDYEKGKVLAMDKLAAKLDAAIAGRRKTLARELRAMADRLEY